MGEGICCHILGTWMTGEGELEANEEKRPSCLSCIEALMLFTCYDGLLE